MAHRLRILTLILLVLGATTALAGPKKDSPVEAGQATLADPTAVLDDIQQGWMDQDAGLILKHFGANKVTISIDGSGPGGSYSRDQGFFVFKELFKATVTRKFTFVQIRKSNTDGTGTFAIAERRYQRRDDGRQIKDKVYISLRLEREQDSGRWVLDEIKSIR